MDRSQRGAGRLTFLCGLSPQAFICNGVITRVELDSDESAALLFGCEQRRAGVTERVENDIAKPRETLNQRHENAERFLRRVQSVAGVFPFEHIGNPLRGLHRIALRHQVADARREAWHKVPVDQQHGEALSQSKQVSEAATQRHSGEARSENLPFCSTS